MATSRGGENIFHALMMSLVDGDWVNMAKLYGYGLHRLQDNITWLRNAFETFGEQLSSTESAGSMATLTGIVNVSEQAVPGVPGTGLDYQGGALLNGKTLTITTDLGLTTVTWPAGITTLSQMLAELASQAPTIGIGTTSASRLQVSSPTLGGSSSISVGGSSFSILFGAVANSVTGGADPDDGASRIGVADIAGLGANTLRFYLSEIVDMVVSNTSDLAAKVSKAGDTMTGGLTIDTADLNVLRSGGSGGNITAGGALDVGGQAVIGGNLTVVGNVTAPAANTPGLQVQGAGTAFGISAVGGAGGAGGAFQAGGTNQPGVIAEGDGAGPALRCISGGVEFADPAPAVGDDPGARTAHSTSIAKAWGYITTNGSGGVTVADGLNVSGATLAAAWIDVSLAHPMSSGAYACVATGADTSPRLALFDQPGSNVGSVRLRLYEISGVAINPLATAVKVAFALHARD